MAQDNDSRFSRYSTGRCMLKPRGYHGDFEIIDAIYMERINPHPALEKWDRYFHAQAAPQAVRNRKAYFHDLLHGFEHGSSRILAVSKLGQIFPHRLAKRK